VFKCLQKRDGVHEVSHVQNFDLYLKGEDGQSRRVRLEFHDYGPDARQGARYRAVA
jgi:hypothetical protein